MFRENIPESIQFKDIKQFFEEKDIQKQDAIFDNLFKDKKNLNF